MLGLAYTLTIGIPLSIALMAIGVILCLTILGLPVGLTCFALGGRMLSPPRSLF